MSRARISAGQDFRRLVNDHEAELDELEESEREAAESSAKQKTKSDRLRATEIAATFVEETAEWLAKQRTELREQFRRSGIREELPTSRPAYDVPSTDVHYLTHDEVAERDDTRSPGYHLNDKCFSRLVLEALKRHGLQARYESTREKPYGVIIASW